MLIPSEQLRHEISQAYKINLDKYAWSKEFKEKIFSIELDKDLETSASTLQEIYSHGYNIGHCGLTSRYLARTFPQARLYYGRASLLVGTKDSPNGNHAWVTIDNQLIDTTLMISVPIEQTVNLGYIIEKEIAPSSARVLSEYELFEHDFKQQKQYIKK